MDQQTQHRRRFADWMQLIAPTPIISACVFLAIGACLGIFFPKLFVVFLALSASCVLASFKIKRLSALLICIALFFLGLALSNHEWHKIALQDYPKGNAFCDGKVIAKADNENGESLTVDVNACANNFEGQPAKTGFRARLFYPDKTNIGPGDKIRARMKFRKPSDYKNPGAFPYTRWLASLGIKATGSITKGWIAKTKDEASLLQAARTKILADAKHAGKAFPFLAAIIAGSRDQMTPSDQEVFSRTGLAHLLSISGLHVGYAAMACILLILAVSAISPKIYLRIPRQRIAIVVALPIIWLYVWMALSPASAVRAGLMLSLSLAFILQGKRIHLPSAIAFAAFLLIALKPLIVFDISFQLSVAAVIGIAVFAQRLAPKNLKGVAKYVSASCAISIAAIATTSPIAAAYFHEISLMGIFANVVAVPAIGFVIFPLAMASSICSIVFSPIAILLWKATGSITDIFIWFAQWLASKSDDYILHLSPSLAEISLFYAVIIVVFFWRRIPFKKIVVPTLASLICLTQIGYLLPHKFSVSFIDVGQGDSTLVRFSNGASVLIDGGGQGNSDFDIGKMVIAPALLRMGVRHVDQMILTHPHADHYKGLAYIAEKFGPSKIWTNGQEALPEEIDDWNEFKERILNAGVQIAAADSDSTPLAFGKGTIEFVHPARLEASWLEPNNASLVIKVKEGDRCALIAGDLSKEGEDLLLGKKTDLRCELLKVGHHGSKSASTDQFLSAVNPKIAVMSVGRNNRFGLPSPQTIERLKTMGAIIKRTDEEGMITWP